jgi:hypothetical protein
MEEINNAACVSTLTEELDAYEAYDEVSLDLSKLSEVAQPLMLRANETLAKINEMLYAAPAFINVLKSMIPKEMLAAVLTDEQKVKIASGALRLMTKKDGSLLATLVNPITNRTVSNIPLKNVKISAEFGQAITNYSSQIQIAQIAEKIELVQKAVECVRIGQERDRLATAFSCQQKLLQVSKFTNLELKNVALLRIAMDAEDSRNLLMQSQKTNVDFIKEQPESFWDKMIKSAHPKEISFRMNEIRDSLYAVNIVSLVEAVAYQEMNEIIAAQQSLKYYGEHIRSTFLDNAGFVERLDQLDDSPESYWSKTIPEIERRIAALPVAERVGELGE